MLSPRPEIRYLPQSYGTKMHKLHWIGSLSTKVYCIYLFQLCEFLSLKPPGAEKFLQVCYS